MIKGKTKTEAFSSMANLQTNYRLKLGFQRWIYLHGIMWFINSTKHHKKNNIYTAWHSPVEYINWDFKFEAKNARKQKE